MDFEAVAKSISAREPEILNPPALDEDISTLTGMLGGKYDARLLNLYKAFDGFNEMDCASLITLWPIKEIVEYNTQNRLPEGYMAFADEMIWACGFSFSPYNLDLPIMRDCMGDWSRPEIFSTSFFEFISYVASSKCCKQEPHRHTCG